MNKCQFRGISISSRKKTRMFVTGILGHKLIIDYESIACKVFCGLVTPTKFSMVGSVSLMSSVKWLF